MKNQIPATDQASFSSTRRDVVAAMASAPVAYGVFAAVGPAAALASEGRASRPTALITGASSGFGFANALTLARNGFHVIASMRNLITNNAEPAKRLLERARAEGLALDVVEIDIDNDASVETGVGEALSRAGRIDVLYNNAGISIPGPVELSMEAVRQSFETNVFGQLRMLRAVAPAMREQGSGLIIQMSSALGRFIIPTSGVYCSTKFALEAMFESAAYELHPFGVEVALIQPSDYATDIKPNSRRYYQRMMENLSADDKARASAYTEHLAITERELRDTPTPPVQEVADIVLELAKAPAGQRPLRTVSMPEEFAAGLNGLNAQLQQVQNTILEGSGMGQWLELGKIGV